MLLIPFDAARRIVGASRRWVGVAAVLAVVLAGGCSKPAEEEVAAPAPVVAPAPAPAPPVSAAPISSPVRAAFASFEFVNPADPNSPTFVFSSAKATNKSPVVITVKDRAMTDADRGHRKSLESRWLSVYVPENFEFERLAQAECSPSAGGPAQTCDVYFFRDPGGVVHEYFLFVGE